MVDLSSHRNFINPQTATRPIFFFKPKTTEKTPLTHKNPNRQNIGENLQDIHRTNLFHQPQDNNNFEDNLGKRQAIDMNGEANRINYNDHAETKATQGGLRTSNIDGNYNQGDIKSTFNPSLPAQTSFPMNNNDNIFRNPIVVQHSINIVQSISKGNMVQPNHDLPSAASTQSHGGGKNGNNKDFNSNNNNRNRFNLDYQDVDYVNRDIKVDVTSPTSQILTHMHQIHPTYIPRSTTIKVSTTKTILNPLLDPNFQPIGSNAGKRWSVKKRENSISKGNNEETKTNVLKASNFPDLPSLDQGKSSGNNLKHSLNTPTHLLFVATLIIFSLVQDYCLFTF